MSDYRRVFVMFAVCHCILLPGAFAACPVTASAVPEKRVFFSDEPIPIDVTFRNDTQNPIRVLTSPELIPGIGFPSGRELGFSRRAMLVNSHIVMFTTYTGKTITPGGTSSIRIYLHTYFRKLAARDYHIPYKLFFKCEFPSGGHMVDLESSGTMDFRIQGGRSPTLDNELASYENIARTSYELDKQQSAFHALFATPSPKVVPILGRLLNPGVVEAVAAALARFPNNPEVATILSERLRVEKPGTIIDILIGLASEEYALPSGELARLMSSGEEAVQLEGIRYAEALKRPEYIPILASYATGGRSKVSTAATRALTVMSPDKP